MPAVAAVVGAPTSPGPAPITTPSPMTWRRCSTGSTCNATLVGLSMGGGEIARCMSRHGGARVAKAVRVLAVTADLLKTDDCPDRVDGSVSRA